MSNPPTVGGSVPVVYANNLENPRQQTPSSVPTVFPSILPALGNYVNEDTATWALNAPGTGDTVVSQITSLASTITVSPTVGTGVVNLDVAQNEQSPLFGMVMAWYSLTLVSITSPAPGWYPCTGAQYTVRGRVYGSPALGGRTIISVGNGHTDNQLGGLEEYNLVLDNIPDHTHGGVGLSTAAGTNTGSFSFASTAGNTTGISNVNYTPGRPVPTMMPFKCMQYYIYLGV